MGGWLKENQFLSVVHFNFSRYIHVFFTLKNKFFATLILEGTSQSDGGNDLIKNDVGRVDKRLFTHFAAETK